MGLRRADREDIVNIIRIIEGARQKLAAEHIDQWQDGYPNRESIEKDIERGTGYVWDVMEDKPAEVRGSGIAAYIMISFDADPDYNDIWDGQWLTPQNTPYAVLHRVAVSEEYRGAGYARKLLSEASQYARRQGMQSVRADTHEDNISMRILLEKLGFDYCGRIQVRGVDPRVAYEMILADEI